MQTKMDREEEKISNKRMAFVILADDELMIEYVYRASQSASTITLGLRLRPGRPPSSNITSLNRHHRHHGDGDGAIENSDDDEDVENLENKRLFRKR